MVIFALNSLVSCLHVCFRRSSVLHLQLVPSLLYSQQQLMVIVFIMAHIHELIHQVDSTI